MIRQLCNMEHQNHVCRRYDSSNSRWDEVCVKPNDSGKTKKHLEKKHRAGAEGGGAVMATTGPNGARSERMEGFHGVPMFLGKCKGLSKYIWQFPLQRLSCEALTSYWFLPKSLKNPLLVTMKASSSSGSRCPLEHITTTTANSWLAQMYCACRTGNDSISADGSSLLL